MRVPRIPGFPHRDQKQQQSYGSWLDLALQTAITLAIAVLAGVFGGIWLDEKLNLSPLFTIVFTLWGAGGGMWWTILKIKQFADEQEKREQEESRGGDEGDRGL